MEIWTPVSVGHAESRSFQILLASLSFQECITVELLCLRLLKGSPKYPGNVWGMLVIFLAQTKQEDNFLKGTEENDPQFLFICFYCGSKRSCLGVDSSNYSLSMYFEVSKCIHIAMKEIQCSLILCIWNYAQSNSCFLPGS